NTVSIRLGDGLGGFSGSTEINVGANPSSVAIGDFNGDGKQDLAVANYSSHTVSIRLGQCIPVPTPTPTPTSTPTPSPSPTPTATATATAPPVVCIMTEAFENIATLVPSGWVRQNNSQPAGTTEWFQGNANFGWPQGNETFAAQSGSPLSYIAADFLNGSELATISNWLLTP